MLVSPLAQLGVTLKTSFQLHPNYFFQIRPFADGRRSAVLDARRDDAHARDELVRKRIQLREAQPAGHLRAGRQLLQAARSGLPGPHQGIVEQVRVYLFWSNDLSLLNSLHTFCLHVSFISKQKILSGLVSTTGGSTLLCTAVAMTGNAHTNHG